MKYNIQDIKKTFSSEKFINVLIMFLIFIFLLSFFTPDLMLSKTTTSGGDMGSDNYLAQYMKDHLLPNGKIVGWSMGRWLGFPIFQFITPLPYIIMAFLGYIIPLEIAFKLITVLGVFILPFVTFISMKTINFKFPVPIIASIFSLHFLFQEKNTIAGGNIPSVLAGEFSYSISFSLMILFLGLLYKSINQKKFSPLNSIIFSLIILSHPCTMIVAGLSSIFFLIKRKYETILKNFKLLFKTYLLALFLAGFWLLPLLFKLEYTVDYGGNWRINLDLIKGWYQPEAILFHILALYALYIGLKRKNSAVGFIFFSILISLFAFVNGELLRTANIRFLPMEYFFVLLLAAFAIGEITKIFNAKWIIPIIILPLSIYWINSGQIIVEPLKQTTSQIVSRDINNFKLSINKWKKEIFPEVKKNKYHGFIPGWIKWNYEGFESKAYWKDYKTIMDTILGTPGRAHNDLSDDNNKFGTPRAFESTPYFADKHTLEGVYAQSTISSPFISYLQCEMSHHCAGIPRVEGVERTTTFNVKDGTKHAKLLNVKHYIAVYDKLKEDLKNHPEWKLLKRVGNHEIYDLTTNNGNYVMVPGYEPILVETDHWKTLSMEWYTNLDNIDIPLVFIKKADSNDLQRFRIKISNDQKAQSLLRNSLLGSNFINEWLICGTFDNPRKIPLSDKNYWDISLDYGLDIDYINEKMIEPEINNVCNNDKKWKITLATNSKGYIDFKKEFQQNNEVIAYAHTYIHSSISQKVRLWYGSDDGIKIWLNNKLIHENHIHRPAIKDSDFVDISLEEGWNSLLLKLEQVSGGWGFYARITDLENKNLDNLFYRLEKHNGKEIPKNQKENIDLGLKKVKLDNECQIEEQIFNEEIRIKTSCIGKPHIIKISYFPNWKVEGADKIYKVSPCFMLIFPKEENVRLYYGQTYVDIIGKILTLIGILFLLIYYFYKFKHRK